MTLAENVDAHKAAEDALQLVIDYGRELELSPDATAHYWQCVYDQIGQIINQHIVHDVSGNNNHGVLKPSIAKQWSTDTSGEVVMPKGKHEGESVADVPSAYFEWLAEQEWIDVASDWSDVAAWMREEGFL